MNHTAVTNRFPAIEDNIRYIRNSDDKIAFIISETGSVIGAKPVSFSAAFGAALWAVDSHLVAMSRGVKRVSNTMRPEATHAFWIPDDSRTKKTKGPVVQGIFPSAPFITDFVGNYTLGQVVEIEVPGQPDLFGAFAMYGLESGKVERVALVNLEEWYPVSGSGRGNATITFNVGDEGGSVIVRRMHADKGSSAMGFDLGGSDDNVTLAGEQWTYKVDHGKGHFPAGHQCTGDCSFQRRQSIRESAG